MLTLNLFLKKKKQGQRMEYIIGDGEDTKVIISIGGSQIDSEAVIHTHTINMSNTQLSY